MSTMTHDTTKTRLLDAAGQVFAERGFEQATVREICRQAKANIASINYHFGGKDELYVEVLAYGAQQAVEQFPPDLGLGAKPSPEEQLHAFIYSLLCRFLKTDRRTGWYSTLCAHEMVVPTKALDRVVRQVIRPMAERLGAIVTLFLPHASPDELNRCAMSIVGQCLFYHHSRPVIERLGGPRRYSDAEIKRMAVHITQFSHAGLRATRHPAKQRAGLLKAASIVMLLAAACSAGCGKKDQGGFGDMVVPVVAVSAERQAVEETIEAVGTLAANEDVDVKSETDGTIDAIHFDEGQQVKAGDVLVEIDQDKLRAALAEAQANLTMAEANRARYAALLTTGAVARQETDQAEATWAANKALVDRLAAELDDATITAPFDGVTGARLLSVGQFIPRGTSITTLIDPDPMKLEFRLPERFLGQVRLKQQVKLASAAYPDAPFTGEVYFIAPQIDPATRSVLLKATVPNPEGQLRHGMFVNVGLVMQVRENAVVIPETALLHQGELTFVYAVDGEQHAQMRPVTVGVRMADLVEITEGLQEREQVVTEGHQKLHPGAKVAPKPPEPALAAADPA